jgi:hypothetical protein
MFSSRHPSRSAWFAWEAAQGWLSPPFINDNTSLTTAFHGMQMFVKLSMGTLALNKINPLVVALPPDQYFLLGSWLFGHPSAFFSFCTAACVRTEVEGQNHHPRGQIF